MKWIPYGPQAVLLQFAEELGEKTFTRGRAILGELERRPPPGLLEATPSFTTVLLEFDERANVPELLPELLVRLRAAIHRPVGAPPVKEIPVIYNGPDLGRVATQAGLTVAEVCRRHAAPVYRVYALGFSPGFPYLGDLDPKLHTPRLSSPRPLVRAGSVAIGGEHAGVYPVDSPGGWNIIGQTDLRLFDPQRAAESKVGEDMFFLHPGDRVRFVPKQGVA